MIPRLIRFKDAPKYLGMDRHCFNREVRPYVVEIRIGRQGIAFDKIDLDDWVIEMKKQATPKLSFHQTDLQLAQHREPPTKHRKACGKTAHHTDFKTFIDKFLRENTTKRKNPQ